MGGGIVIVIVIAMGRTRWIFREAKFLQAGSIGESVEPRENGVAGKKKKKKESYQMDGVHNGEEGRRRC